MYLAVFCMLALIEQPLSAKSSIHKEDDRDGGSVELRLDLREGLGEDLLPASSWPETKHLTVRHYASGKVGSDKGLENIKYGIDYVHFFPNLTDITFDFGSLDNIDFDKIAELPSLRKLSLMHISFDKLNDEQIQHFSNLSHLEEIVFVYTSRAPEAALQAKALLGQILPNTHVKLELLPPFSTDKNNRNLKIDLDSNGYPVVIDRDDNSIIWQWKR